MRLDRSLNLLLIGEIEPALRLTLRAALITTLGRDIRWEQPLV
jgi:hypothetical protein